jgi:hypothetical protein
LVKPIKTWRMLREAQSWRAAWRTRRDNPIAVQAALEMRRRAERRPGWLMCSPWMLGWSLLISGFTTYLLIAAYLRFMAVAPSSVASHSFAINALLWTVVQLFDAATVLLLLWLLERVAAACIYCSGMLASYHGARGGLSGELALTPLNDYECVAGVLQHVLHLCLAPVVLLSIVACADQFLGVMGVLQGQAPDPAAGWPGGQLLWLGLAALLSLPVKIIGALAAILATALTLLSFSPWWRYPSVTFGAVVLALAWHLAGVISAPPGRMGLWGYSGLGDWLPAVFTSRWPALLLLAGLLVLIIAAHAWTPLITYSTCARWGMPALRVIASTGLLCILFFAASAFANYDNNSFWASGAPPYSLGVWDMAPALCWPVQAASIACPLLWSENILRLEQWTRTTLLISFIWHALAVMGIPLLLLLVYAGHARQAVFVRRRVLG